jgi:hypothetical protein
VNEQAKIKGLNHFFQQYPDKNNLSIVNVISMEQPSQTGIKFEAFAKQLNVIHQRHGVKKIVVILTDYLQRHYVALNQELSESKVSNLSNEKGKAWIKKNRKTLTFCLDLKINFEIMRWKKLLERNDFYEALRKVKNLYRTNVKFKSIVDTLSQHFADKLVLRSENFERPFNVKTCFEAAKSYLLEESAIWGPLLNLGFDFITYPGRKNEAVEYTYTHLFQSENCNLPWFRYSFEKKRISISVSPESLTKRYKSLSASALSNFQFFISLSSGKAENFKQKEFCQDRRHSV